MIKPAPNFGPDLAALDDLSSVRDWLRYATTRFTSADLSFGHGTSRAQDEAAYLILHTLSLPIDVIEPWLEAKLTRAERSQLLEVIEKRISTRKPASYLTREAWIGAHSFYVDERVIVPRSYIGELISEDLEPIVGDATEIKRVLDLCTGSGCLAILAALAFPAAKVDAVDISTDALSVALINVRDYGLGDRIRLLSGDLMQPLGDQTYDLIIANPPYVTTAAVQAFPPEYRAEPVVAHAGGTDGMDLVRRILADAPRHLAPDGKLIVELGSGRSVIEAEYPHLPFLWLDTAESQGEVFALSATDFSGGKRGKAAATPASRKRKSKAVDA